MIHQDSNQPEENEPLKDAYQRLQEARDNCIKNDLNTCPLDELTALTEELKAAKEDFEAALEHDQTTNTNTVGRHTIWKREFEALESLAKLNGADNDEVLGRIKATENGRITQADFSSLKLTDISPLTGLTQLTELGLEKNQIQDISPLTQFAHLRWLYLRNNQIQDISPLTQLTQLNTLDLRQNPIRDTRENHETLKKLDQQALNHGGLFYEELETLQSLSKLNDTDIDEVLKGIKVSAYRRITGADFSSLGLVDISSLAQLTQLEWLTLNNNQIHDIAPLAQLTQLTDLGLANNQIEDISLLAHLTHLRGLRLGENKIQDISSLAQMNKLQLLDLRQNPIRNTRDNHEVLEKLKREFASRMGPCNSNFSLNT